MNIVCLIGRMTDAPSVRTADNGTVVATFTVAVDRPGEGTDFIRCIGFNKTAEFLQRYCQKGKRYGVTGRWQTGSYAKSDGSKVYTNDCIVSRVDFADGKDAPVAAGIDEDLPFV